MMIGFWLRPLKAMKSGRTFPGRSGVAPSPFPIIVSSPYSLASFVRNLLDALQGLGCDFFEVLH